jgi:transketolase
MVVTVEAHYVNGGLGSYVAEIMAENGSGARLLRCGVRSMPRGESGSEAYMNRQYGLTAEAIQQQVLQMLHPVGGD